MSIASSRHAKTVDFERVQGLAPIVGGVALGVCLLLALLAPATILPPYLVAFVFWFGIALGCLGLLLLNNLVDSSWGQLVRRPLEAGAMAMLPMAALFLPLLIGATRLYPWAGPAAANDALIQHKAAYLNVGAFAFRALLYFAFWIGLAVVLNRSARKLDRSNDEGTRRLLQTISGPCLLLVFLTATFAVIDWTMSLEPHWYSSLYGPMVIIGWGLATFATMILVTSRLTGLPQLAPFATANRWHDLGNLMLAFVMLWAYMSFAQFLIIYSGNLAEEIPWYLRRTRGGWQFVAIGLLLFQFFLPFFMLLARESKRRVESLVLIAGWILFMRLVDTVWLVLPALGSPVSPHIPWLQLLLVPVTVVGVGGFCVWAFAWSWNRRLSAADGMPSPVAPSGQV